jgi:hypothetical protein
MITRIGQMKKSPLSGTLENEKREVWASWHIVTPDIEHTA